MYVCNNPLNLDFKITRMALNGEYLLRGKDIYQIKAFRTAYITINTPNGP